MIRGVETASCYSAGGKVCSNFTSLLSIPLCGHSSVQSLDSWVNHQQLGSFISKCQSEESSRNLVLNEVTDLLFSTRITVTLANIDTRH